ncbi:D-alanyl-D-alanine carboxypeptidase/D-alanyl-D-alanine-endopeptidase [Loktanella sp. TSTF-M6]|uniref:D-alanyl-D-alanine carboxypeptidase/D-alanyl-D-alanine-endopeptidase n=1 Tax=Loktanella gaetbuli TaxID=2881335 RepID=A0ABS8BSM4_9RHOB|nr:D-alanyl-D-alanine carboxypeptidase/D-alanyl-D-alanine-endopeptidase [Loktanella gaetbuli]MCB5198738.1 D-alanyl-D-alanine carboxypeptidase/D-alanyl-D-alanine-endopeptidase [Loktanella gaetbuli]
MTTRSHLTRRALIASLLAGGAGAAFAAPTQTLRPVVRPDAQIQGEALLSARPMLRSTAADLIREAGLDGQTGFVIADAATGQVLEAVDPDTARPPASVTKAISALYAVESLGADYRFGTRVIGTGPIVEGVLQGDLILAGGGDPTLATDDLAGLVAQLVAAGITGIDGRFLVWDGALPGVKEIEPGQLDQLSYNPSLGGLNLNFNRVMFEWARTASGYDITMDARSESLRPPVTAARMRVVDRSSPIYTYAEGADFDDWTVARRALGGSGSRWLPVRFPAIYAAEVFQVLAAGSGILLPRGALTDTQPEGANLAVHESEQLDDVARGMMRFSTNLTAEVLGMTATAARQGAPLSMRLSAEQMAQWVADRTGAVARFADHSGLTDQNEISAAEMVAFLRGTGVKSTLEPLMREVVMVDDSRRALDGFSGTVRAKTGTLNFVSALAGYVTTAQARSLSFAIFSHDPEAREQSKSSLDEAPAGTAAYNGRAKRLQQKLLQRWLILGDMTG